MNAEDEAEQEREQADAATPTQVSKGNDAPPRGVDSKQEFKTVINEMTDFERAMIRWTRFSTVALVGTWFVIALQWCEMRSGGEDTHTLAEQAEAQTEKTKEALARTDALISATRELADQAKRQADIAGAAINANVRIAQEDRRPWVGLQALQCNNCVVNGDNSLSIGDLSALVVNTGKTPAVNMTVQWTFISTYINQRIPTYDEIGNRVSPGMLSKEVLAPNAGRPITIIAGFRQRRDMEDFRHRSVIYGLGKITYSDTMTKAQHVTMFCVMNIFAASFQYCPSGNKMD